jgi:hypothetical protein
MWQHFVRRFARNQAYEVRVEMTAAEALGAVPDHIDPMGLEIVIPRKITPREITRTYLAPRITGRRYFPTAKGKPPFCQCKWRSLFGIYRKSQRLTLLGR